MNLHTPSHTLAPSHTLNTHSHALSRHLMASSAHPCPAGPSHRPQGRVEVEAPTPPPPKRPRVDKAPTEVREAPNADPRTYCGFCCEVDTPRSLLSCHRCGNSGTCPEGDVGCETGREGQGWAAMLGSPLCPIEAHPRCMNMSARLEAGARATKWECIECKRCSLCHSGKWEVRWGSA